MTDNTAVAPASSPPSFIRTTVDAAEKKKSVAEKTAAREEEAQITDQMEILAAAMLKATNRLKEQADYMEKIVKVVTQTLPGFIGQFPLGQILDAQIAFEEQVGSVEDQLKALKEQVSIAREVLLPERLDKEETRTVNAQSGARMTRSTRVLASIKAGMKDDAFAWLRKPVTYEPFTADEIQLIDRLDKQVAEGESIPESFYPVPRLCAPWVLLEDGTIGVKEGTNDIPSYGSLIQETVNSSSLSSLAKELMEEGKEMPEKTFNIHAKDGVSITKAKKK